MSALRDRELVDELADRPDLLAIADAVAETQRRRQPVSRRAFAIAAAIAAAAVVALVAPWGDRGPGVLDRALAAIGGGPVLHAVVEYSADDAIIDLATGASTQRVHRTEFWYDQERRSLRTRIATDGVILTELVQTPEGAVSDTGPINTGGEPLQLDPLFAGFASGYREALEDGTAKVAGETTVDGRRAKVIEFERQVETTTVLVDAETYRPLRFYSVFDAGRRSPTWTVVHVETVARDPSQFEAPPRAAPRPTAGTASGGEDTTLAEAQRVLGRAPLWIGAGGLESIRVTEATTEFTNGREVNGVNVHFDYGRVEVWVAANVAGAYSIGMEDGGDPAPPAGSIAVTRSRGGPRNWEGELRHDDYWVRIVTPTREQLLAAARALRPVR
jgi:hypothetical protein